jgi:hypothetical protein
VGATLWVLKIPAIEFKIWTIATRRRNANEGLTDGIAAEKNIEKGFK